jgi:regulator of RNase E activity RraA
MGTGAGALPFSRRDPAGPAALVDALRRTSRRAARGGYRRLDGDVERAGCAAPHVDEEVAVAEDRPGIVTPDIERAPAELTARLRAIGTATISGELNLLGIRSAAITGPVPRTPGRSVAGSALTLQCLPKREDLYQVDEYADPERALHRHVLYHAQPGDVVVVDARGDLESGIFGEMMLTYFAARGGVGVVVDGCIRDFSSASRLDLGLWIRGTTPNFHSQTNVVPHAVNVPIACGGTTVIPGDIVVADDDGAVVVPIGLAATVAEQASEHAEWEEFARLRLAAGGELRRYYPLTDAARPEYDAWRRERSAGSEEQR